MVKLQLQLCTEQLSARTDKGIIGLVVKLYPLNLRKEQAGDVWNECEAGGKKTSSHFPQLYAAILHSW